MAISGHKTRSIFDRYDIVSEDDLATAMERTHAYVEQARLPEPRIVSIAVRTLAPFAAPGFEWVHLMSRVVLFELGRCRVNRPIFFASFWIGPAIS